MNVLGARGVLCEEFRIEGREVNIFGKYGSEFGINDLGNLGWKWRGEVYERVTQADELFMSGGVERGDGMRS